MRHVSRKVYRICSIRRRGYYLFHRANLCGFYLRAATNREQRLLNSVFSVKFFVIARALRKTSFIQRIAMQLDQPPLCYKAVPTRHFQSVSSFSSNDFTRDRPPCLKNVELLWTACVLVPIVYSFDIAIRAYTEVCSRAHVLLEY